MNSARGSQGVLWGVVAGVGLSLSAPLASADPAPTADTERAALVWLRISSPPIESQAQLLRADFRFAIDVAAELLAPETPVITFETLLAMRNRALEHRLALSRTGAHASIGAVRVASADATGHWAALAMQVLHGISDTDPEDTVAAAEFEGHTWFAPSINSAPRRLKDLFVGATNRRWDDPGDDFLPNPYPERYSVYPSPGAAGLALIAGGCAMGRRRR